MTGASYTMPPRSAFVDPTKRGNGLGQIATGILGIVLAAVLVIGQISLATTRGIEQNLNRLITHMDQGNQTMHEIVRKSKPTVKMRSDVERQEQVLGLSRDTLVVTNAEMRKMLLVTARLQKTTLKMKQTSDHLASGVAGMEASTNKVNATLRPLPAKTSLTKGHLEKIRNDSKDINGELNAIGAKMLGYGLPRARGVKR
jgi:Tfp pilus assembly protein PilN